MSPHQNFPVSFVGLMRALVRNRHLITQFTKRDVTAKYKGSVMGVAWSFATPMIMLGVYTFVFSIIFNTRWGGHEGNRFEFAIVLYAGLLVHAFFCECLGRAPGLIVGNQNYVKKVVFPLEIFSWVAVFSAFANFLIGFAVLVAGSLLVFHAVPWTVVFAPLVILPLFILALGVAWIISASAVYFRDIEQITPVLTTLLMFLSPIFYPISAVPEKLRAFVYFNPLAFIIEQFREVVVFGHLPAFAMLFAYTAVSALFGWLGFWWFQKIRKGFADVL